MLLSHPDIAVNKKSSVDNDEAQHSGATPLLMAAQQGHVGVAKLLLEGGKCGSPF
jgi:ankyrin repeat protein